MRRSRIVGQGQFDELLQARVAEKFAPADVGGGNGCGCGRTLSDCPGTLGQDGEMAAAGR